MYDNFDCLTGGSVVDIKILDIVNNPDSSTGISYKAELRGKKPLPLFSTEWLHNMDKNRDNFLELGTCYRVKCEKRSNRILIIKKLGKVRENA